MDQMSPSGQERQPNREQEVQAEPIPQVPLKIPQEKEPEVIKEPSEMEIEISPDEIKEAEEPWQKSVKEETIAELNINDVENRSVNLVSEAAELQDEIIASSSE